MTFETQTRSQLFQTAKKLNIRGASRLRKAELLEAIKNYNKFSNQMKNLSKIKLLELFGDTVSSKTLSQSVRYHKKIVGPGDAERRLKTRYLSKKDLLQVALSYTTQQTGGAINNTFQTYIIQANSTNIVTAFDHARPQIYNILDNITKPFKIKIINALEYERNEKTEIFYRHKNFTIVQESTDLNTMLDTYKIENFLSSNDHEFERVIQGSGWVFKRLLHFDLRITKYEPLAGSSYIDLPKELKNKKAIINVKNNDQECFKWAVLSALHPAEDHPDRMSKYIGYESELNFKGIEFPVDVKKIPKFEKQNNLSINLVGYVDNKISVIHSSKTKADKCIDLILISNDETNHYCWVKNFSALMANQTIKKHSKTLWCKNCLAHFYDEERLNKHKEFCYNNAEAVLVIPENKIVEFQNIQFTEKVPFVVYADFESTLEKVPENSKNTCAIHQHIPNSFSYALVHEGKVIRQRLYRGENSAKVFIEKMLEEADFVYDQYHLNFPINGPVNNFDKCEYCKCTFTNENRKVLHHNHLEENNNFIAVLCNNCNLKCRLPSFLPVYFHNLTNYDAHLFVKELAENEANIKLIAQNTEKYISISKVTKHEESTFDIRFLDTFRFMASSLESLANNLVDSQMTIMQDQYEETAFQILRKKGIYPYEYVDNTNKFKETCLPAKEKFYSTLTDEHISDDEYKYAQKVWNYFKCKNFGDYHDIYLRNDVLLLADVFENFRTTCIEAYSIDPAWCYTAPGLAWQAMLKMTKIKLELLDDVDKILFTENGIRGGIVQCTKRYAEANNKYMTNFDPTKPTSYLMYLDFNNLYGWAMSQPLPYGNIKWDEDLEKYTTEYILSMTDDAEKGATLEVDIDYPRELHDKHSDLPFCPESHKKLLLTLNNKKNYIIHYVALKQALQHGLVLRKVHRVLTYNQSKWLAEYIEHNSKRRAKATNDFEKDFYKLMNNSVFGKTMECVRHRSDIRLVTSEKQAKKLICKPNFKNFITLSDNLVSVEMNRVRIKFDKPIYIGQAILDLSKTLLYSYHYEMVEQYKHNLTKCYCDTDSVVYHIKTDDIYEDMKHNLELYDTSDYPKDHMLYSDKNKKVVGKLKDENNGKIFTHFVGLRSKTYAMKVQDGTVQKKLKGVSKPVVKNQINFDDYKRTVFENSQMFKTQFRIVSKKHNVTTTKQQKLALSSNDDKRVILKDRVHTLPYGHYILDNSAS